MPPEKHYRPFNLPDHLSFVSEPILKNILERCGFEVTRVVKYPYMNWTWKKFALTFAKFPLNPKQSPLPRYFRYRGYRTDMFMLARLRG